MTRIATLTEPHPLAKLAATIAGRNWKRHKSLLHHLIHDYDIHPRKTEKREATRQHPHWQPAMEIVTHHNAEMATKAHDDDNSQWRVYTDGSGFEGGVGAAAILTTDRGKMDELRLHLGEENHHEVYEAEVMAIAMGMVLLKKHRVNERVSFWVDNQAAVMALRGLKTGSSHYLLDLVHQLLQQHTNKYKRCRVTVNWIPGHADIDGNEQADRAAKAAAQVDVSNPGKYPLPKTLSRTILINRTALTKTFRREIQGKRDSLFERSSRYNKMQGIAKGGVTKMTNVLQRRLGELPKKHNAVVTQLTTGHIGLNQYLYWFKCTDSPLCPRCHDEPETVAHFILRCPVYKVARERLRRDTGSTEIAIKKTLSTRGGIRAMLRFVEATGRLRAVMGHIPELEEMQKR